MPESEINTEHVAIRKEALIGKVRTLLWSEERGDAYNDQFGRPQRAMLVKEKVAVTITEILEHVGFSEDEMREVIYTTLIAESEDRRRVKRLLMFGDKTPLGIIYDWGWLWENEPTEENTDKRFFRVLEELDVAQKSHLFYVDSEGNPVFPEKIS